MSNILIKPLRTLVGVRRRQGDRLNAQLKQQRGVLAQREAEAEDAAAAHQACVAKERAFEADFEAVMKAGFTPEKRIALEHRRTDAANATAQAAQTVAGCRQAVDQQQQVVVGVQCEIRRNDQRIEGFQTQIANLLSARDRAEEDAAEEEAEETASARFCGRLRLAREQAHGT